MVDSVPNSMFSTDMVSPALRRDAWIESMRPIYDVSPIEQNNQDFKASAKVWGAGGLFFGSTTYGAQIMDRKESKHKQDDEDDYLLMLIYKEGGAKSIHHGKPAEQRPGDVYLLDFSRDHRLVALSSRVEWILAPHKAVGFQRDAHPSSIVLPADTPAGWILSELSSIAFEKLPSCTLKDAEVMAGMLVGTLKGLISENPNDVAKKQAICGRRAVMQRFVIESIADLSLNVETLCRKFGVSRATVFRDFEPGGLQHFMMLHRLDRALNDIASGPSIRGRIAMIAEKWGFSSPAHFSRAFRENFGFSPSDAVGVRRNTRLFSPREIGVDYKWTRWTKL